MNCRFCDASVSTVFIDLGASPPSNSFLKDSDLDKFEIYYPLKALVCDHCLLVQLDEHKSNIEIFDNDYIYFSSYSSSWLKHAKEYVDMISKRLNLNEFSNVIEIASNDGYLLQYFVQKGIPCLGIEPTANTAEKAKELGVESIVDFFNVKLAKELVIDDRKADLIIGNNVLAHDPNLNDLIEGMRIALKYNGVITLEFPHLLNLVKQNQFDTIYHEHYSYFSLYTVIKAFEAHKMEIYDVEEIPTHGGSLRIYARHMVNEELTKTLNIDKVLNKEKRAGLHSLSGYKDFELKVAGLKYEFMKFLLDAKSTGKHVIGYGAAAKGNTLMNYFGIKGDLVSKVVDLSPHKQGKYLPGSRIPVVSEEVIKSEKPDYIIIFPWNIKYEIMDQLCYIKDWGGKFVIPIPNLEIL